MTSSRQQLINQLVEQESADNANAKAQALEEAQFEARVAENAKRIAAGKEPFQSMKDPISLAQAAMKHGLVRSDIEDAVCRDKIAIKAIDGVIYISSQDAALIQIRSSSRKLI